MALFKECKKLKLYNYMVYKKFNNGEGDNFKYLLPLIHKTFLKFLIEDMME